MLLKDMPPMLRSLIIKAVRMWFPRTEKYARVKKKARKESPIYKQDGTVSKRKSVDYKCNICGEYFKSKDVEVDHIRPVVAVWSSTSNMTLHQYIKMVDCPENNLQLICSVCHKLKSSMERKLRSKKDNQGKPLKSKAKYTKKKK